MWLEGCNVGALTIAVASGTQSAKTLAEAGPAAVLPSVAEIAGLACDSRACSPPAGGLAVHSSRNMSPDY